MNRRQLLRRSALAAAGLTAAGALAGCENTTTPIGAADADGDVSSAARKLVVAKPLGPAGLPLPRPDNSITPARPGGRPLPPPENSIPGATPDKNKPIADGVKPEVGPLRIYNYADYVDPATVKKFQKKFNAKVQVATYNSSDEAIAKIASGAVSFDLIMGLTGSNMVDLIARKLLKPINHSYLPNLQKNVWPELADPFYDRGGRYTVPYVVWMDGIGWRNDKVKEDLANMDVPWDIFWQAQPYRGQVGILDDRRDALSMPMQRDAMRRDVRPDLNTEDKAVVDKAQRNLSGLSPICNPKVAITDYQTLPEGKTVLHHSWSGDVLGGAFYYMPKNVPPSVLSFWGPDQNGVVQNDFFCVG